jgi:hypothetical protein
MIGRAFPNARTLCFGLLIALSGCAGPNCRRGEPCAPPGGTVVEPASFWTTLANEDKYTVECRRVCIFQLFCRHVRVGMPLPAVAQELGHPGWLRDEDIHRLTLVGGPIPVDSAPGDTVFAISILPTPASGDWIVYLRVSGELTSGEFCSTLRGEPAGPSAVVRQIGYVEGGVQIPSKWSEVKGVLPESWGLNSGG